MLFFYIHTYRVISLVPRGVLCLEESILEILFSCRYLFETKRIIFEGLKSEYKTEF